MDRPQLANDMLNQRAVVLKSVHIGMLHSWVGQNLLKCNDSKSVFVESPNVNFESQR